MLSRNLPGELIDYIIDFLQDDQVALWTCHLTNSSFRPRARFHIFREISLNPRSILKFAERCAKTTEVPGLVKTLRIVPEFSRANDSDFETLLGEIGAYFKNVTTLVVVRANIGSTLTKIISECFPRTALLRVVTCGFQSFGILFDLLAGLPDLLDLSSGNIMAPHPLDPSPIGGNPMFCASLKSLSLCNSDPVVPHILNELITCARASSITKFKIPDMQHKDSGCVQSFIDAAGNGLRDIYIGHQESVNLTQEQVVDLKKVSLLQRLTFSVITRFTRPWENDGETNGHSLPTPNQWVPDTLRTISSKELKTIIFKIHAREKYLDDARIGLDSWKNIVNVWAQSSGLTSVQLVSVRLRVPRNPDAWKPYMSMLQDVFAKLPAPDRVEYRIVSG